MLEYLLTNVEVAGVATLNQINLFLLMLTLNLFERAWLLTFFKVQQAVLTASVLLLSHHGHGVFFFSTASFGIRGWNFGELAFLFFFTRIADMLKSKIRVCMVPRLSPIIPFVNLFLLVRGWNFQSNELALTVVTFFILRNEAPVVGSIT